MSDKTPRTVFDTEDLLKGLCDSVAHVLSAATGSPVRYSGMAQRIAKTCLKPDIACFVLFDGGFSGIVVMNFSAPAAMELYETYMLNMGMSKKDLSRSYTSDDVGNVMGELMNQIVGDFTGKVGRELQTHITQNQPKMLVLNKMVALSVDTNIEQPEARRVTFFTERGNVFYLELGVETTEFVKLHEFEAEAALDPDEIMAQARDKAKAPAKKPAKKDHDELLKSLGM